MALLSKSSSYQEYLKRIQEYRSLTTEDQIFSDIQSRTEKLFSDVRSRNDQQVYYKLLIGICAASIVIGVVSIMMSYYFQGIVLLAAPLFAWYHYNHQLKSEIEAQQRYKEDQQLNIKDQLMSKVQYLIRGLNIKIHRITIVRWVYMLIFPALMISLLFFIRNEIEVNRFLLLVIAFIIGSIFWYYYFKDDLDELEYQQKEMNEYHQSLILQIHSTKNQEAIWEEE